eukprot:CAMPEP_0117485362 /NCGR_PEP_ID=MMETSP0784-20121206/14930_1 /TAXON_ID=39447 /ORGANISM="" /LENGTH=813 /DNA_ID=CAMNT_0005279955 /DNA_START=142 /DNA_END=2583 /DNA_ORIENTATION=-
MDSSVEPMDLFEGPEKTLSLCFKTKRMASGSLRLISRESWQEVLDHAKCQIVSQIDNAQDAASSRSKSKRGGTNSKGLTAYLLSESSLFLSDSTLTLKTCGETTPLKALGPILDLVVPAWRTKYPGSYLKYATFTRLGYKYPDKQVEPHCSWTEEVEYLEKFFKGDAAVLGSMETSTFHVYVANYAPLNTIFDCFSTQVALTELDPVESMTRLVKGKAEDWTPLTTAWERMYTTDATSIAANPALDEHFFEPIGYSANATHGKHFTTVHATPQPECSYISVETSAPLTTEGRRRFVEGATAFCPSRKVTVSEYVVNPMLLSGAAPQVDGFRVVRSSKSVGIGFACALHEYVCQSQAYASAVNTPSCSHPQTPLCRSRSGIEDVCTAGMAQEPVMSKRIADVPILRPVGTEPVPVAAAKFFLEASNMEIAQDNPTALLDIGALKRRAHLWHEHLPRVEPFYAVKCNPFPAVLQALWELKKISGKGGFDCASPAEMDLVTNLGADPAEHIVYANPCRQVSALQYAKDLGVRWLVFDNAEELRKLSCHYPSAELVLRVETDDAASQCPLSNKFGATVETCRDLLHRARDLNANVVGLCFHVGSGCSEAGAFRQALKRARLVFDEAARVGYELRLLDIGGGFPGWDEPGKARFIDHAADINETLEQLFPSPGIRIIAEPGRFFVAEAQSALVMVVSVADTAKGRRYYINDGLYGSFNCLLYDHAELTVPWILRGGWELDAAAAGPRLSCTVFGPTCDGFDVVAKSMELPCLEVGDCLVFPRMGAYTSAASTSFNGFAPATAFAFESTEDDEAGGGKV